MRPGWASLAGILSAAAGFGAHGLVIADLSGREPAAPALEMHYAPGEDLEPFDVGLINEAGETIDMAAYILTDSPVIEALRDAARRGVKIRLYRFPPEHENKASTEQRLDELASESNVETRFKRTSDLMHLKSYCVDGRVLRGGAANFSASGLKRQDNDLTILRAPGACAGFEKAFEAMWRRGA